MVPWQPAGPPGTAEILHKWGIDPEGDDDPGTDDDPVPESVCRILNDLDTDELYEIMQGMPMRESKHVNEYLKATRKAINKSARSLWKKCVGSLDLDLPLLVLDEAHHLKNPHTRLASLFHISEAQEDVEEIVKGPLGGAFERMLFLTATPFQLGHGELCSVLDRFTGISWDRKSAPSYGLKEFKHMLSDLRSALDSAQEAAVTLDLQWGRLSVEDLIIGKAKYEDVESWWQHIDGNDALTPPARQVMECYERVKKRMGEAEQLLRPWVIRHIKKKHLPKPK